MKKIIIGENITKSFTGNTILNQVNIEIEESEFIVIMGPSGSGKSTLMNALSGMDEIDSGKIIVDGNDISNLKENQLADLRRKEMGFVFQQPTLLKNLNILDNIVLSSMVDNKQKKDKIVEKAKSLMQETGITTLENRSITQVSGGQLQRVGICRALMNEPKIIYADEPTGALNSKSSKEIMQLLSTINHKGTTILLVTHDANVAAWGSRTLFMIDGKIIDELNFDKINSDVNIETRAMKVIEKMNELGI